MTKYAWVREPKLDIYPARRPVEGLDLSGVVIVLDGGPGYVYVRFTQEVVEAIGKKMPHGIGGETQAYLKIMRMHGHYDIVCVYNSQEKQVRLWKSDKLPRWVRKVRHATTEEKKAS